MLQVWELSSKEENAVKISILASNRRKDSDSDIGPHHPVADNTHAVQQLHTAQHNTAAQLKLGERDSARFARDSQPRTDQHNVMVAA